MYPARKPNHSAMERYIFALIFCAGLRKLPAILAMVSLQLSCGQIMTLSLMTNLGTFILQLTKFLLFAVVTKNSIHLTL